MRKQGLRCYLDHRNKTQPTPPSPSCLGGGLMGKRVSEEVLAAL